MAREKPGEKAGEKRPPKEHHPDVVGCVVRLTADALNDLDDLFKADPQIVRWACKKMIQIERDPYAGQPLLGGLVGYRKITVGDRDWRVVWRVTVDDVGTHVIDVAEVWAVGYRKDNEVYVEVAARVAAAGPSPEATALTEVLTRFAKQSKGLSAAAEPAAPEAVPEWLRLSLVKVVGVPPGSVEAMSLDEATARWESFITGPGSSPP